MAQLPIGTFLTDRLKEYDSTFELRPGTGFEQLFFKPVQFITQPLLDDMYTNFINQSFSRILNTEDPDSYDEEAVDALASNLYVYRREGAKSSGVARIYYNDPNDYEYPQTGFVATSSNGQKYTNPAPFSITEAEMTLNIEDGLYYYDILLESIEFGADTVLGEDELISVDGDTLYIRATNLSSFAGGVDRETNTQLINRVRNSIGVRDLLTGKGINAILFENFPNTLQELTAIGFGDQEMMRDIVYNTHIGGKVDAYIKTNNVTTTSSDFIGLEVDSTRQTYSSKNCVMTGISWIDLGNPELDRSNGKAPVVTEIKNSTRASYLSTADLSSPIDLSTNQYVKIGIDGTIKDIRLAGVVPSSTSRNEIVNLINYAFGINVASISGTSIILRSPSYGLTSQVFLDNPSVGTSAILEVFGLAAGGAPYLYEGEGPVTFLEGVHYEIDDPNGRIRRVIGSTVLTTQTTGRTDASSTLFKDLTAGIFNSVSVRDIVTILTGPDAGDYRVLEVVDDNNLILDVELTTTALGVSYSIARTGIKNGETVYVTYYYNPISVDIGKYIKLDEYGRVRGVRTGREDYTLTNIPLLRINYIEEIDPLTLEPTGVVLDGTGGYGQGGYGRGGFGRGAGRDWALSVNSPAERFSMFEDSYIIFQPSFIGLSVRVHFDCVPEISAIHDFCRSDYERIVDGDVLVKHYLPAYVSGTIQYTVSDDNVYAPTNDEMIVLVKQKINTTLAETPLEYSDLIQFMARKLDPYDNYGVFIKPFVLTGEIHNTNGTTTKIGGTDRLVVPTLDPFPKETNRPLSPKIVHWIADDIVLERL